MDLQLFIAINAMTVSALLIAVTLIYRPADHPDWLVANGPWLGVNAGVLAVGLLAMVWAPAIVGTLVALVFVPLVAAPSFLFMRSQRMAMEGRVRQAALLARMAAFLHPTTANRINAKLTAALAGDDAQNEKALAALAASVPLEYRPHMRAYLAMVRRDWPEVLALTAAVGQDPSMKPLEIRALGESGQTDAMVQCFVNCRNSLSATQAAMPRLLVLAFGGRPNGVAALMDRQFAGSDDDRKAYWIAVGQLNSRSDTAPGERALAKLAAESKDQRTRASATRQLKAFIAAPPATLPASTQRNLDFIEGQVLHSDDARRAAFLTAPVTLALIALNVVVFIAEVVLGGSEDADTLIGLGALWPPLLLEQAEWWRLLTAAFLHFGPIHIASNMFVLWVLGRLLEPMLGSVRMLAIYLAGAVLSSIFVLWLMASGYTAYGLLVGASGAIFALLGAEATIVLLQWWRDPENFDRRKFSTLAVMLGLQIAIDLSVPNVSFAAHVSGFFAGMIAALALVPRVRRRLQTNPPSGAQT